MNDRGQAYSTFKLLIAAIVALAILMILLPIISSVLGILQNDPTDKTRELLNNLYNQPETLKTAEDVTFTPNSNISGLALSEKLPLGKNEICMSLGDYEADTEAGFAVSGDEHHRITWNGVSNKVVDIVVVCNLNFDMLEQGFDGTIVEERSWEYSDCEDICGEDGRCCLVALKRPS